MKIIFKILRLLSSEQFMRLHLRIEAEVCFFEEYQTTELITFSTDV